MTTPVITDFPLPFPAKGQSDTDFDNNVDAYLSWLSGTNVPELQIALPWVQARLDEVAATALSGTLPDISAQALNYFRVNAGASAVEFRTPAQVLADIGAATLSGKNLIINGSGRVNQRGYVSGAATAVANQFTLDRWFVVTSGQNLTFTGTDAGRTITAPANGAAQIIEGANILGGTYVINWTGTATAMIGGVSRAKGETFTLAANTNVRVAFFGGTYTDVQIELGTVATAFEQVNIGLELARCQRYYEEVSGAGVSYASSGAAAQRFTLGYTTKRALPTVTVSKTSGSATSPGANTVHQNNVFISFASTSASQDVFVLCTATAELTA